MEKWERNGAVGCKSVNRNQSQTSKFLLVDFITSLETQSSGLGKQSTSFFGDVNTGSCLLSADVWQPHTHAHFPQRSRPHFSAVFAPTASSSNLLNSAIL